MGGDFLWHSIDGIYSVYIADVTVSDVSFLWAGLANGVFGRNIKETTSDIAKENNAIFAINGDFYAGKIYLKTNTKHNSQKYKKILCNFVNCA